MTRANLVLCLALGAGIAAGCADGTAAPTDHPEATLMAAAGADQTGLTGTALPDSLVVRLTDGDGEPLTGRTITWETAGDDAVEPTSSTTDDQGLARTLVLLGPAPGTDSITARGEEVAVRLAVSAEYARPDVVYSGRNGYVTYTAGSIPVILTAPHGGTLEPDEIPDRAAGTQVRDADTDLLAEAMADSLAARLGGRPHLIVSRLHRRKLDPNREIVEAAEGHPLAEQTWAEFHAFIEHASDRVAEAGPGLLVDVHGHGHDIQRLELGYLLDADDLALSDSALAEPGWAEGSSLRALAGRVGDDFPTLLRGPGSLGSLFENGGVPAVPSQAQPDPGDAPFFAGGYDTRRHGSREGGAIDAVQMESHRAGIRDTPAARAAFGGVAASAIQAFLEAYYGVDGG